MRLGRRHRDDRRAVASDLLGEPIGVLAGREADDLQPIGVRVDDRQRALADRAGRSENGDALHQTVLQHDVDTPARRRAARRCDRGCRRGRESARSCPSRRRCASASTRTDRRRCRARRSTMPEQRARRRRHGRQPPRADDREARSAEDEAADGAFDRFLRADRRRQRRAAERAAGVVLRACR